MTVCGCLHANNPNKGRSLEQGTNGEVMTDNHIEEQKEEKITK